MRLEAPERAEIRRWALAVGVTLAVYVLGRLYGGQILARWGLPPSAALLSLFSLGSVQLEAYPPQPGLGWVCRTPWHLALADGGDYLPVILLDQVAHSLLPLAACLGCLALVGGAARRRPGVWLTALALGIAWCLTDIAAGLVHGLTVAVTRQPSPFLPSFTALIPPDAIVTDGGLGKWFYPSGLLARLMQTLAPYFGLAMWAGLRGIGATHREAA